MPSVSFVASAAAAPAVNRTDVQLGNFNGFEEINLAVDQRLDAAHLTINSQNNLLVSSDAFINNNNSSYPVSNFGDTWSGYDSQGRLFWTNLDGATGGVSVVQVDPVTSLPIGTAHVVNTPAAGDSDDRQALAVDSDPTSPNRDNIYVVWTRFFSGAHGGGTQVLVSRSNDQGVTWSTPAVVGQTNGVDGTAGNADDEGFVQQVHISVAPNGDVFAAYHSQPTFVSGKTSLPNGTSGQIFVGRSTDGGLTFTHTGTQPFGPGAADITFNRQENTGAGNGNIPGTQFLTQGSVQPYVIADPTRPNNIYVIAADDPDNSHGSGDDSDIVFARSTDNGATWTTSTLEAGPSNSFQLFPTASIDRFGNLVVSWYDNRNGATNGGGNFLLDTFAKYSIDGGLTFSSAFQINDAGFDPDKANTTSFKGGPTTRIGEYFGLANFGGTAYVGFNGNSQTAGTSEQILFDAFPIAGTLTVNGDDTLNASDQFIVRVNPTNPAFFEVLVNGQRQYFGLSSAISQITVNGLGGDDTLTIDNSNGLVGIPITYHGGAGSNSLAITGNPGFTVARETYLVGATEDAGTWVVDQNDAFGAGAVGATAGANTEVIQFDGLAPADTDTPAAIFDVIMNTSANNATIQNGGLLNGAQSIQVFDDNATFETFRFANKTTARIMGQSGSDTFRLNYTIAAAGLTTLEVYGHVAPGVAGQPADDNAADLYALDATAAGVTNNLFGQGGSDRFNTFGGPSPSGTNTLANLAGTINITGGETAGDDDELGLSDDFSVAVVGDSVTLTNSSITGAAPAAINYVEIEDFIFEGTPQSDTIDILSTAAGTNYVVSGDGGPDTFTIGNQTADFNGNVFDGSLDAILGVVTIAPEGDIGTIATDTLNIDDSGTPSLAGAASITNLGSQTVQNYAGFAITGLTTALANFAPVNIKYFHGDITAGLNNAGNRLEFLNVRASTGPDSITVNATTTTIATTIQGLGGSDSFVVTNANTSLGALNIDGGAAVDKLTGPNLNNIWNITGANAGNIVGVVTAFLSIENLIGGTKRDVFHFAPAGIISGQVKGGTGNNWLDYSAITTSIAANLQSGAASRVGGWIAQINNVLGSKFGGDKITGNAFGGVLVGHNANNVIHAGAGRTVIIGGFGFNTLIGGAADDLLINGRTIYDANFVRLEAILAIWQGPQTYYQRIAALQAPGPNQLKIGLTVFVSPGRNGGVGPRVGRGGAGFESTLIGNGGLDWFITNSFRSVSDKQPGEIVTTS